MTLNTTLVDVATKDLNPPALDWAMADLLGLKPESWKLFDGRFAYSPSTDWFQGGELVDKYRINFATEGTGPRDVNGNCPIIAFPGLREPTARAMEAPSHLVAACRAIVATYKGDTVKVPACLVINV